MYAAVVFRCFSPVEYIKKVATTAPSFAPRAVTRAFMARPRDTLLNHDSAAEAAARDACGEPLDQLVAEDVRQAKAVRSDGNELATPEGPAMEALVSDTLQLGQGREGGTVEAGEASGRWLAYGICTLVTWNLFCNHWNRDSVGALELPLEAPPFVRVRVRVRTLTLTLTLALPLALALTLTLTLT